MSAFCLDLQTPAVLSAPLELDSDCMEPRAGPGAQQPGGFQGHQPPPAGSGGLGTALEEELALISGERGGEEQLAELEAPASGHHADMLLLFRQKEKDLVLAAKLGKALLERNQDLTKQYEKMHKDLSLCLSTADLIAVMYDQLRRNEEVLRWMSGQMNRAGPEQTLEYLHSTPRVPRRRPACDQLCVPCQIKMLSERKMELERRVHAMMEENELLQNTVDDLRERTLLLEKQCHEKDLQLRQSQLELQEVQTSRRHLTAKLAELTEENSLQTLTPHPSSLLCEIEQSMEQEEQEQEREQLRLQLWEAYCEVRSLCSHLRGNDVTDSALSTDSSMDESSETSSVKDVPTGSLHTGLLELRRLTQNLLDGNESTMALLSVEICSLREDNVRMRAMADVREPSEQLQSAIRDRDDAIANVSLTSQIQEKIVIDQQLMDKHQDEWRSVCTPLSGSTRSQSPRRARRFSERDKRLFSFFKKN
uniref:BICD family like cargo adaptor 1 n=1 Tax=Cyprinodon variegatus TaxID=28743 RepID=A0A3Q2E410_CYPVA